MLGTLRAALLMASALGSAVAETTTATVEVELQQGRIQGVKETIGESRFYYSFKGIPFAQPPVGDLRFKDPVPAEPWSEVRRWVVPPVCPQFAMKVSLEEEKEIRGEEDCLYLNVYTPQPSMSGLPVMVYIHGGAFKWGDADSMGGTPHRMLTKDIVLVSIQYRLGTLGFLSTGDSVLPGNFGLKDQTLALKWVQDNVRYFGGDPNSITIFGESAGSASVHYQMLTPYSEGLFNRAIMHSGTAITSWALRDDHAEIASKIGRAFDCPGVDSSPIDSTPLLSCLREASVVHLVAAIEPYKTMLFPFFMEPRVDGDYLPDHPAQLLREGRYHKVDLISGNCRNEASSPVKGLMSSNQTTKEAFMENYITNQLPLLLSFNEEENSQYLTQRVFYNYLDEMKVTEDNVDDLEQLMSDGYIAMSQDEVASLHGRDTMYGKRVYRYELQHRGQRSFGDWVNTSFGKNWVAHLDDLQYLFDGVMGYPPVQRLDDVLLSDIMVSLWTNFAKTGNPTPDLELGFKWDSMTSSSDLRFLALTPVPKMKEDIRAQRREFWRNLPLKRNKLLFPDRFL